MGVQGLETFLEKKMPNEYCYEVNIQELAEKYRGETGRQPIIVVDGPNCLRSVFAERKDKHWLLGGQLKEFVETVKCFASRFKNIGIDLKFFFGSIIPEKKKEWWILRRNKDIESVVTLFHNLIHERDHSINYMMPAVIGAVARFAIKFECGCDTEVTLEEQDVAIARYGYEHECFAILSQDSDYIFMDGARHYLSLKHLNLDTMTTVTYEREALKRALKLEQHELLLLPVLLGCETLPPKKPLEFLKKICPCKKVHNIFKLVPIVTKFIKDKNIPKNSSFDYLRKMSLEIFGTEERAKGLELCIRGYMYEPRKIQSHDPQGAEITPSEKEWNEILEMAKQKHETCSVTTHLYPVMLGHEYELSIALENYSDSNLVSTAEAYLPLRQRIYGILFYEKPHPTFIKEFCIQGMECPTEAKEVPIKWIFNMEKYHPGLRELWSENCSIDIRWNLFVQNLTVKNKLDSDSLKELGFPYAVPVAVLYYLVQERKEMLNAVEIDVILAQAASLKLYTAADIRAMRNQLQLGRPLKRVVEISTIFLRGVTMVLFLLSACGFSLHETMPWFYFDGKLLLQKYIQAVEDRKEPRELCDDIGKATDVYETYNKMKNLVMSRKIWY